MAERSITFVRKNEAKNENAIKKQLMMPSFKLHTSFSDTTMLLASNKCIK